MTTFFSRITCFGVFALGMVSMTSAQEIVSTELFSPVQTDGDKTRFDSGLYKKACFNLVTLRLGCEVGEVGEVKLHYGNRFGDNWDIFSVSGSNKDQTRGKDLGMLRWDDAFTIPEIEPWAKLQPGERRHITVNTSGADGAHGKPGRNADGTYPAEARRPAVMDGFSDKPVDVQVKTAVQTASDTVPSSYNPFMQVSKGHIYAFHVVDEQNDFYILVRIDDLIRGTKASISYQKVYRSTSRFNNGQSRL